MSENQFDKLLDECRSLKPTEESWSFMRLGKDHPERDWGDFLEYFGVNMPTIENLAKDMGYKDSAGALSTIDPYPMYIKDKERFVNSLRKDKGVARRFSEEDVHKALTQISYKPRPKISPEEFQLNRSFDTYEEAEDAMIRWGVGGEIKSEMRDGKKIYYINKVHVEESKTKEDETKDN